MKTNVGIPNDLYEELKKEALGLNLPLNIHIQLILRRRKELK